ncbi:hypothetical protein LCGC14_2607960, partial [marine sediment metagenome]
DLERPTSGTAQPGGSHLRTLMMLLNVDKVSKRFGGAVPLEVLPEIDLQMAQIAVDQRTPYMYEQAVGLVRGNHASEIADEALNTAVDAEIEKRTAAGSLRSGGITGGSPLLTDALDFNSPEVPEEYRRFKDMPENDVNEFLKMAYPHDSPEVARQKYMKQLTKGNVITAVGS